MIIGVIVCLAGILAWHRIKAHARARTGPFRTPTPPVVVDCSALHRDNARDWRFIADRQDADGMPGAAANSRTFAEHADRLAWESAR